MSAFKVRVGVARNWDRYTPAAISRPAMIVRLLLMTERPNVHGPRVQGSDSTIDIAESYPRS
jgi:hypothetical protein